MKKSKMIIFFGMLIGMLLISMIISLDLFAANLGSVTVASFLSVFAEFDVIDWGVNIFLVLIFLIVIFTLLLNFFSRKDKKRDIVFKFLVFFCLSIAALAMLFIGAVIFILMSNLIVRVISLLLYGIVCIYGEIYFYKRMVEVYKKDKNKKEVENRIGGKFMLEELKKLDSSFTESMFKTKVDNIFVLMMSAIMFRDITRVYSSLNQNMRNQIQERIDELNRKNEIQMYDELNVKHTEIEEVQILEDKYIIKVLLTSRYMDYKIDATTKKFKSGNNSSRIELKNRLIFEEKRDHKSLGIAAKCPSCGANIDYNYSGVCEYCKKQMPKENYDWILTSWEQY